MSLASKADDVSLFWQLIRIRRKLNSEQNNYMLDLYGRMIDYEKRRNGNLNENPHVRVYSNDVEMFKEKYYNVSTHELLLDEFLEKVKTRRRFR